MTLDTKEKLSRLTVTLHWLVGVSIIGLLAVGTYMEKTETLFLYPLHKSFGVIIFIVVLARVFWRIKNGWPPPANRYKKIEQVLAKITHWVLILGTVIMPISGMIMSGAAGHGIHIFGLELLAMNPNPQNPEEMLPLNKPLAGIGHETHEIIGKVMIVAVLLHIIGAFKHHLVDKDGTLRRMLGADLRSE
ncbi:MAG: cytochrome b [Porticoccaceae bacterium]|nr:cytochrome b [Pseudomonadales bacterium]MCP5171059.1 cytochrome b [Pseudomonadales bacterium]MCP5301702.1 cytochrome b [Pseudomonadales bacterium]